MYTANNELRLSKYQHVRPHRFAESAPTPYLLRGALGGKGFAYQFAARAAALVCPLASVRITPTASYRNRAMLAEIITRAFEVCDRKTACGYADNQWVAPSGPSGWGFNSVLDTVVGLLAFGLVVKKPGEGDAMLRLYVGVTAAGFGEKHFAFASDCFPRASSSGVFAAQPPAADEIREETR